MTSEDVDSLDEDELDEIVNRVVDRLEDSATAGDRQAAADEAEERAAGAVDSATEAVDSTADAEATESDGPAVAERDSRDDAVRRAHEAAEEARDRALDEAAAARERARSAAEDAGEHARSDVDGPGPLDDLGERIERSVEASLAGLAADIERAFGSGPGPEDGVTLGPEDTGRKAVYKTQLQKGGRVAVPDAEIEALDLDPGDTLQVVLYPVA